MISVSGDAIGHEVRLFLEAIYVRYSHDFRQYAPASIQRRIERAIVQFNLSGVGELQQYVMRSQTQFDNVLPFLTVPVSAMFRDPAYFIVLRERVIPLLKTYSSPKIWIAGCSTGEEVYSMAILLLEEGLLDRAVIYATDINPIALNSAMRGIFPIENLRIYTENYHKAEGRAVFSDYYHADYDHGVFDRSLRRKIIFSDHSLATDSAFAETHFISCRNTLIYFDRALQNRAFGLFYESLCRRGFLGLGLKETVEFSDFSSSFDPFMKAARIFRKNGCV
jgi:chemotaxis protein methyltransferase CheR